MFQASLSRGMICALLAAACLPGARAEAEEISVFAAASLKTALDRYAEVWEGETGHQVLLTYAGSNLLAKQIIEGAPADLFLSASEPWMDEVEGAGLIADGARLNLLGNQLVLIAHGAEAEPVDISPALNLRDLLGDSYLAMALVDAVPAGQYGKAALTSLGLWDSVSEQVAQTDNVRAALALVATGEARYGITYASDARAEPGVTVVGTFPNASHPPILYPAALLTGAKDAADTEFFKALRSPEAAKIFASEGFSVLTGAE